MFKQLFVLFSASVALLLATVAGASDGDAVVGWVARILAVVPDWLEVAALVTTAAAAIAALTPTKRDDEVVGWVQSALQVIRKLIDALALNVGNAKNREPAPRDEVKNSAHHR